MNKIDLLKKMLPGLIPLLIFVLADEIWGTKIGLQVAVVIGLGELIYFYIKEKRIEKFVLLDIGLIVVLGGVSLISANDIFFLLKPALLELILCVFLFISAYTPKNLMLAMSKRYIKGIEMSEEQMLMMTKSIKVMFWIVLFHTALIVYSAYFMSKEAWVFISSILLYLIIGVYFFYEFLKHKISNNAQEWVPLVNEEGEIIGKATRKNCHSNPELLHPIARMHIFNSSGQVFLQKRMKNAETCPNMWDAAVAGHVKFGEKLEIALKREAKEEMNLIGFQAQMIGKVVFKSALESELLFLFMTVIQHEIKPNFKEVQEGRYFTISQLRKNSNNLTPALLGEIELLEDISKKIHPLI